jgi:hypothetical protein
MDLARAPRRTARKKGSGYENDVAWPRTYSQTPAVAGQRGRIQNGDEIGQLGELIVI